MDEFRILRALLVVYFAVAVSSISYSIKNSAKRQQELLAQLIMKHDNVTTTNSK